MWPGVVIVALIVLVRYVIRFYSFPKLTSAEYLSAWWGRP